jgi:hypothetical protein
LFCFSIVPFCLTVSSYIISVVTINDIGEGKIMPGTGQARFKCSYTAIVMKPFKGEVVDGKVVNVNKVSFFVRRRTQLTNPDGIFRNGRSPPGLCVVSREYLFNPPNPPHPSTHSCDEKKA